MNRYFISSILVFLTVGVLESAIGLKWVPISVGDTLPTNIVLIDEKHSKCVGRAKSDLDAFYPAEVSDYGLAVLKPFEENIQIRQSSEILTTSESDNCEWKPYFYSNNYEDIDQNVVRAGVDANGDAIFIGRTYVRNNTKDISSIYLPSRKITQRWREVDTDDHPYEQWQYLSCDTHNRWVDSSPTNKRDDAVFGGKSVGEYDMYIARLKIANGNYITGYVIPEKGAAVFDSVATQTINSDDSDDYGEPTHESDITGDSDVFQILTGDTYEYSWISVENGIIPDDAVVNGKQKLELAYVARINKSIRHMTQSEARLQKSPFDILVKN